MSHKLGLSTVAEGIEIPEQLDLLQEQGCAEFQGYLLGRPMPNAAVQGFISDRLLLLADTAGTVRETVLRS